MEIDINKFAEWLLKKIEESDKKSTDNIYSNEEQYMHYGSSIAYENVLHYLGL